MRPLKQVQASGANGARSRNSTRHGSSVPHPSLNYDPPTAFIELRAGFMATLRPRNVAEAQLIHTMAVAYWRKLQIVEAQAIGMDRAMASHLANSSDPDVQVVLAFESASECHTLHRDETAFDLQADRILRRLLTLRSRTKKKFLQNEPSKALNLNLRRDF